MEEKEEESQGNLSYFPKDSPMPQWLERMAIMRSCVDATENPSSGRVSDTGQIQSDISISKCCGLLGLPVGSLSPRLGDLLSEAK